jgi:hypothetical protein
VPIPQKLRQIHSALWLLVFASSPLLLFVVSLGAGLWVTPIVVYMASLVITKTIYKLFTKTQVLIDENKICLTFDCLGLEKKYSASAQDVIRLERFHWSNNQDP